MNAEKTQQYKLGKDSSHVVCCRSSVASHLSVASVESHCSCGLCYVSGLSCYPSHFRCWCEYCYYENGECLKFK